MLADLGVLQALLAVSIELLQNGAVMLTSERRHIGPVEKH